MIFSGVAPFRERTGLSSKKLSCETQVWNPHRAGAGGRFGFDRSDVPFAEMAAAIAGLAEELRDRDFFGAERPAGREGPHAVRVPAGQEAGSGRRAIAMAGVEAIEA